MDDRLADLTQFGIGLFALLNPFVTLPYVLAVSSAGGSRAILTLAAASTATALAVLLGMHLVGEMVLVGLGTSLASFQVAGGLVMLLSGLAMMQDDAAAPQAPGGGTGQAIMPYVRLGVAPLGTPMLAGAGSISKVILETHPGYGIEHEEYIVWIIVAVCLLSGAIIAATAPITRLVGRGFFSVMSRLSGLIIIAIAIEIMSKGIFAHTRQFLAG